MGERFTAKEVKEKCDKIYSDIDDLIREFEYHLKTLKEIRTLTENLPTDEDEIEGDVTVKQED